MRCCEKIGMWWVLTSLVFSFRPIARSCFRRSPASIEDSVGQSMWGNEIRELLLALNSSRTIIPSTGYNTIESIESQYDDLIRAFVGRNVPNTQMPTTTATMQVLPHINTGYAGVPIFSSNSTPMLVVHGNGRVGQHVLALVRQFRSNAKSLQVGRLSVASEREVLAVLDSVKTVVIAVDGEMKEEKDFLGRRREVLSEPALDKNTLQKLLNAARKEMEHASSEVPIKVVLLGRACKPPRSAALMLLGDHTDIESETILLCRQRGLAYNVVNVGKIIDANSTIPSGVRRRHIVTILPIARGANVQKAAKLLPWNPLVFTQDTGIEHSECTYENVAAEALFRAAGHPDQNATFTVLSAVNDEQSGSDVITVPVGANQSALNTPTESEWADAFLWIVGPELLRLPLQYASYTQALQRVHVWGLAIAATQSVRVSSLSGVATVMPLVTPVEVEVCDNGIRLHFRPARAGAYRSSKEDKMQERDVNKGVKRGGDAVSASATKAHPDSILSTESSEPARAAQRKASTKRALEGGMEVIVEREPYTRVRVRRCEYGPGAVVKVESEGLLLQAVQRAVMLLESECSAGA